MSNNPEIDQQGVMRVAEAMISVIGANAPIEARLKAAEALDNGDMGAFRGWYRIFKAAQKSLRSY